MGVCASTTCNRPNQYEALLVEYKLGEVIGQGAFGIVYDCTSTQHAHKKFAVKMIDKAETKTGDIEREVEMLERLSHPSVIKLHKVFWEKIFVCVVTDLYEGGDLIHGMQRHWETKGKIPPRTVAGISRQMFISVAWLHSRDVVHRDIKGDNFLMDRSRLDAPALHLVLSDFGTVVESPAGKRHKEAVGTRLYWAPEFFDENYSKKVDVWAAGVVTYGLLNGTFPFKDETATRQKRIEMTVPVSEAGRTFILAVLERREKNRTSAQDALRHSWLLEAWDGEREEESENESDGDAVDSHTFDLMRESGPARHLTERRHELVQRWEREEEAQRKEPLSLSTFVVSDTVSGRTATFEWWPLPRAQARGLMNWQGAVTAPDADAEGSLPAVQRMLSEFGISTVHFGAGEAKTLAKFAAEVQSGEACLMLDAANYKRLVRVVDIVVLRIEMSSGNSRRYLVQESESYPDGRVRNGIDVLPGMKRATYENARTAAGRLLIERLGLSDADLNIDYDSVACFEEEEDSPSYPGVRTVYRKSVVPAKLQSTDKGLLTRLGSPSGSFHFADPQRYVRVYKWLSSAECVASGIRMAAPSEDDVHEVSALMHQPEGLRQEELSRFFQSNGIDGGRLPNLNKFCEELSKGEASFKQQPNGKLIRVVDVVVLLIFNRANGQILVETSETIDGKTKALLQLPGGKRHAHENHFVAARRVIDKVLGADENSVSLTPTGVKMFQEFRYSKAYPGIPTVYRKRVISCEVVAS